MNRKECILKDKILEYLNKTKDNGDDVTIAKAISCDPFEVASAAEQLEELKLVELMPITGRDSTRRHEYHIILINQGIYFYRYDSFISKYKVWKRKQVWTIVKTVAGIINAMLIVFIALASLWVKIQEKKEGSYKKQDLQKIENLERKLQQSVDSLNQMKGLINMYSRDTTSTEANL